MDTGVWTAALLVSENGFEAEVPFFSLQQVSKWCSGFLRSVVERAESQLHNGIAGRNGGEVQV